MSEAVFDTSILVDHLRDLAAATKIIECVKEGSIIGHISILTEAELFAGKDADDSNKRALLVELLNIFDKTDVNEGVARVAGEFRRKYNIALPDAIIAATAFMTRCKLLTKNLKDFKRIGEISAEEPY
jgi:hypothetical protein